MDYKNQDLTDLFEVLIPLLIWGAIGWFLFPYLISIVDIHNGIADIEHSWMISIITGFICLALVVVLTTYLVYKKREKRELR